VLCWTRYVAKFCGTCQYFGICLKVGTLAEESRFTPNAFELQRSRWEAFSASFQPWVP
jgi:hypothetical protein